MTEAEQARKEIDKVLDEQSEKKVKRWQIAVSLFSRGFSERQVGIVMGIDSRTSHSYKIDFKNNKAKRAIKNYLRLDVIKMQIFTKHCKALVGQPHGSVKGEKLYGKD